MSGKARSRWIDEEEETAYGAQRKKEKEKKRRVKAERQRITIEAGEISHGGTHVEGANAMNIPSAAAENHVRGPKRRKLSNDSARGPEIDDEFNLLTSPGVRWGPCRHVDSFEKLNHIEEGSYGWVSRARENATGEIVALKKLKMGNSPEGFPVTGLREIQTLMEAKHANIVNLREVVMGDTMSE